jgi:hypothetical protein
LLGQQMIRQRRAKCAKTGGEMRHIVQPLHRPKGKSHQLYSIRSNKHSEAMYIVEIGCWGRPLCLKPPLPLASGRLRLRGEVRSLMALAIRRSGEGVSHTKTQRHEE